MYDYIKREDAKQFFCDNCRKTTYEKCEYKDTCASIRVLNRVPSADVVERNCRVIVRPNPNGNLDIEPLRKRGEWIPCTKEGISLTEQIRKEGAKWYGYKCSECGYIYKGNALREADYCQKCGADNRGAEWE